MEIIAACDFSTYGIGYQGTIPWSLTADMIRFRDITTSAPMGKINIVVMGRKTWESIYEIPLRGRLNIVITSHGGQHPNVVFATSLREALKVAASNAMVHKVFVIGGTRLYDEALQHPKCMKVHMTYIHKSNIPADTFFPMKTLGRYFEVSERTPIMKDENNMRYSFFTYERKK